MEQREFGVVIPNQTDRAEPRAGSNAAAARAAVRRRRKRVMLRRRIVFGVGCCAVTALFVASGFGVLSLIGSTVQQPADGTKMTEAQIQLAPQADRLTAGETMQTDQTAAGEASAPAMEATGASGLVPSAAYVFSANDPRLVLVNNNVPLSADYAPAVTVADPETGKELETEAAAAYQSMAAAAQADGISLMLCSGYRDYEYQKGLFEARLQKYLDKGYDSAKAEALAKTIVAMPGCSEHQTGYAADIVTERYQGLDSGFAKTDAFAWLSQHAADYGFILRYPENRQSATGIVYEPWHWRYVGLENAAAVVASGLSLEEFLAVNQLKTNTAS